MKLIHYSRRDLTALLMRQSAPLMESTLFKKLTSEYGYPAFTNNNIFEFHFSLYHALYTLKHSLPKIYLHTDPMRIRGIALPEPGQCGFYFESSGTFCKQESESAFCKQHSFDHTKPVFDCMSRFYLDEGNIDFAAQFDYRTLMQKVLVYGFRKKEIDEALEFFKIPCLNKDAVHKNYRSFAKMHHPDKGAEDEALMKEANRHFALLKALF